ncbi:Aorsin, partial [Pseudocercospora fuligena]
LSPSAGASCSILALQISKTWTQCLLNCDHSGNSFLSSHTFTMQSSLFSRLLGVVCCLTQASSTGLPQSQHSDAQGTPQVVTTTIAFRQHGLQDAEALLAQISDPASPMFGQYLDVAALALIRSQEDLFAPSHEAQSQANARLRDSGISVSKLRLHKDRALLRFDSVGDTLYEQLRLKLSGGVPRQLREHVEFIKSEKLSTLVLERRASPVSSVTTPHYNIAVSSSLKNCSESWTPSCIRRAYLHKFTAYCMLITSPELYGIPLDHKAAPNNSLGIFGLQDIYNQPDLDQFFAGYAQFTPEGTHPKINDVNGALNVSEYIDGEESLDLQMAYPIASGGMGNDFLDAVDGSYCTYDGGDDKENDPQYPAFQGFQGPAMCGTYNVTNVVSLSFAKDETEVPRHYLERQCHEWMKLALRGVTVIVGAGDRGVSGNFGCAVNPINNSASAFGPLFPGSCPYVTTVGATQVNFTNPGQQKEVSVYDKPHNFWSGGGFSNIHGRPSFQAQAVSQYLAKHDPHYPLGTFNASGRAYPDVALLGANVTMVDQGKVVVSGGTSAAAPLFAAMISRINDERLLAGKKAIGFLNRILYEHPEVFNDITEGSNPGCGTAGFEAAKGWDPVSGLGSPNFSQLRSLLVGLP